MTAAPVYLPFILAPPFTSCEESFIVFGQGYPPFSIFPIATGDGNGTSLENVPLQVSAGVFKWTVDFNPGANITWALVDSHQQKAFSDFRVVQQGITTSCPKNTYTQTHASLGGILGGVLGTLLLIALLIGSFFLFKRWRTSHPSRNTRSAAIKDEEEEEATVVQGSGLVRAGTFNLRERGVEFTPNSVDRLREMRGAPPKYEGGAPATETVQGE